MTLVSVVTPAYNCSQHIQSAVQSVLTQTYSEMEVIVVDDQSRDNTVQCVQECAHQDSRLRLIKHRLRKGAQAARNTAIRAAQGEWVAFLDCDDQWLPDSLETRLQLAIGKRVSVVHTECDVLHVGSAEPQRFGVPDMHGQIYKEILRKPGPMFPGLLVSREALTRIGYLDDEIIAYQEWDTAIRLAKYYEFGFVPQPTFIYDCRHANTISKDLLRGARGYEQVFTKHRWSILRHLGPKALAAHYQAAADLYREADNEIQARRCLRATVLWWPFRPRTLLRRMLRSLLRKIE